MAKDVISQRIQDAFVLLSITDTRFLDLARSSVKTEYFGSSITENLIKICYSYYDQFEVAPDNHFHDEFARFIDKRNVDEQEQYFTYIDRLLNMEKPNRDYVVKRINDFIKAREFEKAALAFAELTAAGEFVKARELMQHSLKTGIESEEIGLSYLDEEIPSYYNEDNTLSQFLMPTGFSVLDKKIRGIRRGQLIVILGGYKGKKSWTAAYMAQQAVVHGLKVLHISHEMSVAEIEARYDMSFGGLLSEDSSRPVQFEEVDEKGGQVRQWSQTVETIFNEEKVIAARKAVKRFGGKLIIKKYPMGTCTMEEIDRYLDYLETYEGFIPDVIVNDYVEIMKLPLGASAAMRDRINQAYIEHKRIADERNIAMITVSQATRGALQKSSLDQQDFAEDIRKLGNVDIAFGVSQNRVQKKNNRLRITILGGRSVPDGLECMVSTNIDIGQLCLDCWEVVEDEAEETDS